MSNFIIDGDYNTQKQLGKVVVELSVPSFSLDSTGTSKSRVFGKDAITNLDSSLEYLAIKSSVSGDMVFSSPITEYLSDDLANGAEYAFIFYRKNKTTYHLMVRVFNLTDHTITVPAFTVTATAFLFSPPPTN